MTWELWTLRGNTSAETGFDIVPWETKPDQLFYMLSTCERGSILKMVVVGLLIVPLPLVVPVVLLVVSIDWGAWDDYTLDHTLHTLRVIFNALHPFVIGLAVLLVCLFLYEHVICLLSLSMEIGFLHKRWLEKERQMIINSKCPAKLSLLYLQFENT